MKRLVLALTITVAFLVGCLTATVATKIVVPPIKAGTNPQKWEYQCERVYRTDTSLLTKILNTYGSKGWEVAITHDHGGSYSSWTESICFKRPLP